MPFCRPLTPKLTNGKVRFNLSYAHRDLLCCLHIPFRVDLRDSQSLMPQNDLSDIQPKILPKSSGGVVTKLMRMPAMLFVPFFDARVIEPLRRRKRFSAALRNGLPIGTDSIVISRFAFR